MGLLAWKGKFCRNWQRLLGLKLSRGRAFLVRSLPATKGDLRDLETVELLEIAARGEDSRHQFKADFTNAASMAAEIVALANSGGGKS